MPANHSALPAGDTHYVNNITVLSWRYSVTIRQMSDIEN